jgi:hypothetical protein
MVDQELPVGETIGSKAQADTRLKNLLGAAGTD